ncbi:MAG TPA: hypothetical protein VIV65_11735, partial [Gemmatimonadaceae bacterium]
SGRKLLLIGIAVMYWSLGSSWTDETVPCPTTAAGGTNCFNPMNTGGPAPSEEFHPTTLGIMAVVLLWAAYRGRSDRRWMRFIPLVAVFFLGRPAWQQLQQNERHAKRAMAPGLVIDEPSGPKTFLEGLIPFGLGALLLAGNPYPWRRNDQPAFEPGSESESIE